MFILDKILYKKGSWVCYSRYPCKNCTFFRRASVDGSFCVGEAHIKLAAKRLSILSVCLSSRVTWSKWILVRWLGTETLGTSVRRLDVSVIGHCALLRGVLAFVYISSVSGELPLLSVSKVRFRPSLAFFKMPHFVCWHVSKICPRINILCCFAL